MSDERLRRAPVALRELREQLDRARAERRVPLAVVGLGCRFPGGADDPDALWSLLEEGRDVIGEVPRERWESGEWFDPDPERPGTTTTRWGGFLDGIDRFDAAFFAISPREAAAVDPQQRLLLEVAWEALEHAAIAPDRLAGSRTGVWVGINSDEYYHRGQVALYVRQIGLVPALTRKIQGG